MNYLLDTSIFIWLMIDERKISARALEAMSNAASALFFSSISQWELWQKHTQEKLRFSKDLGLLIREVCDVYKIVPLSFSSSDCSHLSKLPLLHKDPFDRMLICQAIQNNLTMVTSDKMIRQYPIATLWD